MCAASSRNQFLLFITLLLIATFVHAHKVIAAGRQLTGPHAPASSEPLSPAEAQKHFQVPDGFEMRLFAAEPDVINPVAMTWDERGRLWVVELFEYPFGKESRDRIKILEDTDGDGRADKVTQFADKLNLATGILLGNGGVYVGQAPQLLFLKDTNGDDVADERTTLLTGFGLEDRHELLNGFTWGPDGWLYMTHGVFTHSKVKDPNQPQASEVIANAAVARFHPRTKQFEVFADGTSNPWGVDFDRSGNAFVSACVIDHLFHMAPGGLYVRQGGQPEHRYSYGLIPSIVDHKHFRAAFAGIQIYQGDQYPPEYRGRVFMGNIHANAVNQDLLEPRGSTFKASPLEDFVRTDDGWFRSVSEQVGPDGALWIMDWYDKYPCYQNATADPEGVDRQYGRVWRAVYVGKEKGKAVPPRPAGLDLAKLTSPQLVDTLAHPNVWQRRMAQRLLSERRDPQAAPLLLKLLRDSSTLEPRLAALWTLHGSEQLDEATLDAAATNSEMGVRLWAARLTGERRSSFPQAVARLKKLASDREAPVRLAVAVAARQYASSSLTVNTPVRPELDRVDTLPVLGELIRASANADEPTLPLLIWMAAEPRVVRDPSGLFDWLASTGSAAHPLSEKIAEKAVRRISDTGDSEKLSRALTFISSTLSKDIPLASSALDGLLESQRTSSKPPPATAGPLIANLVEHTDPRIRERGQRLGAIWGNETAMRKTLASIGDSNAGFDQRLNAIQLARQFKTDAARQALAEIIRKGENDRLTTEAISAVAVVGDDRTATLLIDQWPRFSPGARQAAAEALVARTNWTGTLLSAVESRKIAAADIPVTAIRSLAQSKDAALRQRAATVIGRIRAPDADKSRLIAQKKRVVATGSVDLEAGRKLAETTCLTCHKLHGKGADVGPDLTGVGRSTLDALLANVIDPNQIIGKGYENVIIETKDARSLNGRMIEDTAAYVKLASAGPREEIVRRGEIASMRVSEQSVMPEGLEQLPDQDFRNLIWFILNPPEDKRAMTAELRRELVGDLPPAPAPKDLESVALWNPEWAVRSSEQGDAPAKFFEYAGHKNVLMTYPFGHQNAAALERAIEVPAGKKTALTVNVASHENGRWVLRVFVNGKLLQQQPIDRRAGTWQPVTVDLSSFAGSKVQVRLENYAYNLENDYAYWSDLTVTSE